MILTSTPTTAGEIYTGEAWVQIGSLAIVPGQVVDGILWDVEPVDGWDTPAAVTERMEQRNADHGGWLRQGYFQPRDLELKGLLNPVTGGWSELVQAWSVLRAAVPSFEPVTLIVAQPGEPVLQASVVQSGQPMRTFGDLGISFSFALEAADPRRYSTVETVVSTGLPVTSGGLSLPLSLPLSIGATTTSGVLSVVNEGDVAARPVFTVSGPCPPFSITHSSGRRLAVPDAVEAGRVLTIDTDSRSAVVDGTATRVVTGTWFELDPGVNEIQFNSASYDAAALLSMSFRSAWR